MNFNAKHTWWGSRLINPKGRELFKCITKHNISTLSTGSPTYWPSDPRTIPDLLDFLVYKGISAQQLDIYGSNDLSSDHTPVLINYFSTVNKKQIPQKILTPSTNMQMYYDILDKNINLNFELKSGPDIDHAVEFLMKIIHEAASLSTPADTTQATTPLNLNLSFELRRQINAKRRLRRKWQQSRSIRDKRNFNKACKKLKESLQEYANDGTAQYLEEINDSKYGEHKLFKATKYLKRPSKRNILVRSQDGTFCRTDKDTADAFAEHLQNTFQPFSFNSTQQFEEI